MFWLAGGYGSPEKLKEAPPPPPAGIQVGTPFAYSAESGMREDYKQEVLRMAAEGKARVFTRGPPRIAIRLPVQCVG